MKFVVSLMALLIASSTAFCETLAPFTSDGCSSFPDGTSEQRALWLSCCVEHDKAYWMGGTFADRAKADEELRTCVAALGERFIAELMRIGVRVGGSPFFPTDFRWGYGWPYPRGYGELTEEEKQQVDKQLKAAPSVPDLINQVKSAD